MLSNSLAIKRWPANKVEIHAAVMEALSYRGQSAYKVNTIDS